MNYILSLLRENIGYKNQLCGSIPYFKQLWRESSKNINHITLFLASLAGAAGEISSDSSPLTDGGGRAGLGRVHFMAE